MAFTFIKVQFDAIAGTFWYVGTRVYTRVIWLE